MPTETQVRQRSRTVAGGQEANCESDHAVDIKPRGDAAQEGIKMFRWPPRPRHGGLGRMCVL